MTPEEKTNLVKRMMELVVPLLKDAGVYVAVTTLSFASPGDSTTFLVLPQNQEKETTLANLCLFFEAWPDVVKDFMTTSCSSERQPFVEDRRA